MAITLAPWDVTLGQAKTRILRVVAKQNDTDSKDYAGEVIQGILRSLNDKREWNWLNNTTTLNVTTDGLIALPSRFNKFYSVAIVGQPPLEQWTRRDFRHKNPYATALGGTYLYVPFNLAETAKVEIRDHPAANVSVELDYNRLITIPANNTTGDAIAIDVPETVGDYILAEGKAQVLGEFGGSDTQLTFWMRKSSELIQNIVRSDVRNSDRQIAFTSAAEANVGSADYDWGNHA